MKKKCLQCGNEFSVASWNAGRKFCVKECRDKYTEINNSVTKICKICKREFKCSKTEGEWRVCCSKECSDKLKDKIKEDSNVNKICVVCGKEFETYKCHPYRVCCSPECNKNWSLRFRVKEICVICGKEKWVAPSRHRAKNPICGSTECRSKQQSILKEGEGNPNYKGRVKKVNCIVCNRTVKDRTGDKRFCSLDCKGEWQKKNLRGINNPFFGKHHTEENKRFFSDMNKKGEWQNINRAIRSTNKMIQWKKDVFKRDNWTCQKCGARSKRGNPVVLHAHHITPLAELIASYTDIEEKFKEDDYVVLHDEYFYDIDNGVTYCTDCHKGVHKRDGLYNFMDKSINK